MMLAPDQMLVGRLNQGLAVCMQDEEPLYMAYILYKKSLILSAGTIENLLRMEFKNITGYVTKSLPTVGMNHA